MTGSKEKVPPEVPVKKIRYLPQKLGRKTEGKERKIA